MSPWLLRDLRHTLHTLLPRLVLALRVGFYLRNVRPRLLRCRCWRIGVLGVQRGVYEGRGVPGGVVPGRRGHRLRAASKTGAVCGSAGVTAAGRAGCRGGAAILDRVGPAYTL